MSSQIEYVTEGLNDIFGQNQCIDNCHLDIFATAYLSVNIKEEEK
jgi:hypothetical protein